MSNLSIGLVTSPSEESKQLISLLESLGVQVTYHITPQEISTSHIEDQSLNVWLLNMDDDDWHDNIDQLLDESDASIYFNEPGTLVKQTHPEFWCQKLISRLYELTGLDEEPAAERPTAETTIQTPAPQAEKISKQNDAPQTNIDSIPAGAIEKEIRHSEVEINQTIESADELSSALDQLETSSIGLPSDIAADLVSELESISPELESFSLEDELSDLSVSDDDPVLVEETDEDFSEITLDVAEADFSIDHYDVQEADKNDENAEITDEIMALAGQSDDVVKEFDSTAATFDEIDFSSSSIPVLESAREDDEKILESNYGPKEDEEQRPNDTSSGQLALSVSDETKSTEQQTDELSLELDGGFELDSHLELDGNLELDDNLEIDKTLKLDGEVISEEIPLEQLEQEITGKANFMQEENSVEEEALDVEEPIEQDGLSLTSIDEEKITGKAVYLEEEQKEQVAESVSNEQQLDGLSLESIEQAAPSGRASFIEEEPEEQPQTASPEPEPLDDGGLTLESDLSGPIDGKAEYVIDDQPKESEITKQPVSVEKKIVVEPEPEEDLTGLNLEPMTDQNQTSWLDDDLLQPDGPDSNHLQSEGTTSEKAVSENTEPESIALEPLSSDQEALEQFAEIDEGSSSIDELDFDIDLNPQTSAAEMEDLGDIEEPQDFEIPMLEESATGVDFEELIQPPAESELTPCWVIGASLGGPAAVKRFLQSLPANINASFIVAQHIDENFLPVLAEILTSNSHFEVQVAKGSNDISAGKIYLAPLKGKLVFLKDGSMLVDHSQKWSEPYLPCIDDVIESLAAIYGKKSGAIIFSGMGQDGLNGVKKMLSAEGQVWAQSVDTCANASMPEAVINAGLASVIAAPELLADRLVNYLNQ